MTGDGTRAIALFNSSEATAFLEKVASLEPSESLESLQSAVAYARDVLANRGNRIWARQAVEGQIRFMQKGFISTREVDRLRRWPRDLVREVVLDFVSSTSGNIGMCLYLLSEFGDERDVEYLRQNLDRAGPHWGDTIREKLPSV